jgi:putative PIN family toxin of toxin-antitoxin system
LSIVLDTNVLVSGLLRSGTPPGRVLDLVTTRAIDVAVDERILAEYREVLLRPEFNFMPARVHDVIDFVWRYAHRARAVPLGVTLPDPDDEKFLEVAVSAGSSALVTGNLRHYPADRRQGTVVLTPREFLGVWTHGGDGS